MTKVGFELPGDVVAELDRLTIEDAGVTKFSEVVTSCFAGASWFDLLGHLDGTVPSPCHDALALLAKEGLLAGIVTTNFDTLIERAFADHEVPLDVYVPFEGVPPVADLDATGHCRLVKVHGSVSERSSLVDLARQKARGLPPLLRAWLSRVFAEHPLLVVGFSGADLELDEDYFGFDAALPQTPWLRWISRPGRPPLPAAAAAVATAPDGLFLEGELPGVLEQLGIEVPAPREEPDTALTDPREWVDAWLGEPGSSPEACAALSARLLDIGERPQAAASIRDTVRAVLVERLANGVNGVKALSASLALAQFGSDLIATDPKQALTELTRSRKIIETLFTDERTAALSERSQIEQSNNAAGTLFNIALAYLALSEVDQAERALDDARSFVEAIPAADSVGHRARAFYINGLIHRSKENYREALLSWRQASLLAESSGALDVALSCAENRWRTLVLLAEVDLAGVFHGEALSLRSMVPAAPQPPNDLDLKWGEEQRRAVFPTLIDRLGTEVRLRGERFDEVLFSAWAAAGDAADLKEQLREALMDITPSELDEMEPRQRALAAIARHALAEGDEIDLLTPVPTALNEWFQGNLLDRPQETIPAAKLVLHPDLRNMAAFAAKRWSQAGIVRHREERWEEAEQQFVVGGCGFALAGEPAEAVRALLYAVDAIARQERYGDAEGVLRWLGLGGGPESTAEVLSRRIKMLSYRVAADELDADDAITQATPLLLRLENLHDDEQVGAGLVSLGSLNLFAGNRSEAAQLFKRAEALFVKEEHKQLARSGLEKARQRQ